MTAVKQRAINIINMMPETEVMQFVIKNERYEKLQNTPKKTYKKRDYVPNPKFTEANRTERMNRFKKSAGTIDIDEDAVREMCERSMI